MDEELDYIYTIECVHKQSLVNQCYEYCDLNLDLLYCNTCPMKQSKEVKGKITSTSTKEE